MNENVRLVTGVLVFGMLVVAGIVDVGLFVYQGRDATVSVWIRRVSEEHPIVPFSVGVLIGHLFAW